MKLTKDKLLYDLYVAFYDAKRHKSKKPYVISFEKHLKENLDKLADELLNKTYKALPSNCFVVNSPKKREVFAAQFRDRIVHHLYYNYTHELYERTFIADSYSCIPERGTLYGALRLEHHIKQESNNWTNKCYIMKIDIRGYFMHINRQLLCDIANGSLDKMSTHKINKTSNETWGQKLDMDFIKYLTNEIVLLDPKNNCVKIMDDDVWVGLDPAKSLFLCEDGLGLPVGNLTSQLFSNVYLNLLDQFIKRELKCKHYGRYVDDSYIVSSDKEFLLSIVPKIRKFMNDTLHLEMNMGKLIITDCYKGVEFLGMYIKPYRNYLSNRTLERMIKKINKIEYELNNKDLYNIDNEYLEDICRSINAYLGIMSHISSYNLRKKLFFKMPYLTLGVFDDKMTKISPRINYF